MSLKKLADRQLYQKSFQILKRQFQVQLWFRDKRTTGSVCAGQQISRLSTNTSFTQYGSEPPLDKWKAGGDVTKSSCLSPSLLVTSTTRAAVAAGGASLHSQSALPAGFWRGLAAQSSPCLSHLVAYSLIFSRRLNLEATALLTSEGQLISLITKENTARLPGYHLSNLVSINSAFCKQEKWRTGQFVIRRAEKMTTAGFPFKPLKVPSTFWQQFDAPGKKKKKRPCPSPSGQEPSAHLGHHLPAQGCPSWSQGKAHACWHPEHPMAQHTFLLMQQLGWLPLSIDSYHLILQSKFITCPANPSHFPKPSEIPESHYYTCTTPSKTVRKGATSSPAIMQGLHVGVWGFGQLGRQV